MVRLIYCLRRKEGMSLQEFQRYWREVHGPLVEKHAQALRIRRYIQVHTLDTPLNQALGRQRGCQLEPYDGVAELWWDSLDDFQAAVQTEEGREAARQLAEDEARFIDVARSTIFLAQENAVIP
jgi:uncharacterized protein (TIGR02118 family)